MIKIILIDSNWPPSNGDIRNNIVLTYDDWNDYSYRTSFRMYYCNNSGEVIIIGELKIYYYDNDSKRNDNFGTHTRKYIKSPIEQLSEKFCSLGQEISYYTNLKVNFPDTYIEILNRLNDLAFNLNLKEKYFDENGVQTSLLRWSSALKALEEARDIVNNEKDIKSNDISFIFKTNVPYCEEPVELKFNFSKNDYLPYRINVLIGKNGAGKTQLLTKLANALSGYTDDINESKLGFIGKRPPIDKVMSISYSAFDSFKKPPKMYTENDNYKRKIFSYVYCGIQSAEGTLNLEELKENFNSALDIVKEKNRFDEWKVILSELIEDEHQEVIKKIEDGDTEINWSSGQHIIISTITELIANIENESIILFDEPEIHLHPNAIANLMRMFYRLLNTFNSYAIFSTHSPIIVQEIPSAYIQILIRNENILTVRKPEIECLGDNISNITTDIFDVSSLESNYKSILMELNKKLSAEEINKLFNKGLSLNALIFLKNINLGDSID